MVFFAKARYLHRVVLGSTHQPWPPSHGGLTGFRRGVRAQFCCVEVLRKAIAMRVFAVICNANGAQKQLEADKLTSLTGFIVILDES